MTQKFQYQFLVLWPAQEKLGSWAWHKVFSNLWCALWKYTQYCSLVSHTSVNYTYDLWSMTYELYLYVWTFIHELVYDQFICVNLRCLSLLQFLIMGEKDSEGVIQSSADAASHTDKILLISWLD